MKNFFSLLLLGFLVFQVVGCGPQKGTTEPPPGIPDEPLPDPKTY